MGTWRSRDASPRAVADGFQGATLGYTGEDGRTVELGVSIEETSVGAWGLLMPIGESAQHMTSDDAEKIASHLDTMAEVYERIADALKRAHR